MRNYLTIALLFCFTWSSGQDQELRELLGMEKLSCPYIDSVVQHKIISLKADERQDSIPNLLAYWQANCEPSEAAVRIQILTDVENRKPTADLEALQPFLESYYHTLRFHEAYPEDLEGTAEVELLNYTQTWADSLLKSTAEKSLEEKFLLEVLAAKKVSSAENLPFTKNYHDWEANKELRKSIRHSDEFLINWELGILSYHYQEELAKYLGITPAIHAGVGASINEAFDFILYGQVGISNFKKDLRINEFDSSQFTSGHHSLSTGLQFSYTLLNTANFDLRSIYIAGYKFLDTGLEEERVNSEGETYEKNIGLHSYDLGIGLQTDFRLHRHRHLGIRVTYHFTDFNLGTRALNDMSGGHLAIGLILR